MSNPTHVHKTEGNSNELRLVTKALVFLLLLQLTLYHLRRTLCGLLVAGAATG